MTTLKSERIKLLGDFIQRGTYAVQTDNYAVFQDKDDGKYRIWYIGENENGGGDLEFDDPHVAAEKFWEITANERLVRTDDEIDELFLQDKSSEHRRDKRDLRWVPPVEDL